MVLLLSGAVVLLGTVPLSGRPASMAALRGFEDLQRTFQEREDREHALRQQQA